MISYKCMFILYHIISYHITSYLRSRNPRVEKLEGSPASRVISAPRETESARVELPDFQILASLIGRVARWGGVLRGALRARAGAAFMVIIATICNSKL